MLFHVTHCSPGVVNTSRELLCAKASASLAVRSQETGIRHLVVWLFAVHGGFDPAVWWPRVWTVRTQEEGARNQEAVVHCYLFFVSSFGDVFGARIALLVACSSTVVFFLLLAIADHPIMLFVHKVPTVFMHVLPGNKHLLDNNYD